MEDDPRQRLDAEIKKAEEAIALHANQIGRLQAALQAATAEFHRAEGYLRGVRASRELLDAPE